MKAAAARKGPPIGDERILLRTSRGDLVVGLYDSIAPKHAAQIRKLVRLGVYDSTTIFRIEPGFVAQITNAQNRQKPLTSEQSKAIAPIPAEFSRMKHRAGMVSMARDDDDKNSAETSFSFVLGRAEHLDGQYTVIGEVEFGRKLLERIAREPRDWRNRPKTPIVVEKAELITEGQFAELKAKTGLRDVIPLPPAPK